jgi:hypothetical protein
VTVLHYNISKSLETFSTQTVGLKVLCCNIASQRGQSCHTILKLLSTKTNTITLLQTDWVGLYDHMAYTLRLYVKKYYTFMKQHKWKKDIFSAGILFNNIICEVVLVEERETCSEQDWKSKGLTVAGEMRVVWERFGCPSPSREGGLVVEVPGTIYATPPASWCSESRWAYMLVARSTWMGIGTWTR